MTVEATRMRTLGAIAVIALVLGAVAGCGTYETTNGPSASSAAVSPSEASSGSAPASANSAACAPDKVGAQSDGWGGAAGSRGADVVVDNTGDAACVLPPSPAIAILDDDGRVVLESRPDVVRPEGPTLEPGADASFSFEVSNWCDESAVLPFHVTLVLAGGAVAIAGVPIESLDDLPPCNGPGQPPTASATDWTTG